MISRTMAPTARSPEEVFSYRAITAEIQAFIDTHPRGTQQRLADAAFPELSKEHATAEFRHRMDEREGSRFDYEHLGRIAVAAGKIEGRPSAPLPWPLLKWKDAEAIQGVLVALAGTRS